ncbi:MAG TPA: tetratricopeptide repeat protein, partial [Caulobacteraceae bacterium]|nr:tetratricopeptide repeat protein [Caulobacteraceae bacterium]
MSALPSMDADDAVSRTREALRSNPENGELWRALGMAHELRQEFDQATLAYERALQLMPDDAAIAGDLGRLAHRLGMLPQAVQLLSAHLQARPGDLDAINTLACVLRDQHDYDAAIALLRDAIAKAPEAAALWNTLGTVLSARGDGETARTFFLEALRLEPHHPGARYNLACAELELGEVEAALADCERALAEATSPSERATIGFARATMLLCAGRLGEGWDAYEARFDPDLPDSPIFEIELPRLAKGPAAGRILVVGEQGVGDEILFASLLPDLAAEGAQIAAAVDPRLVGLFERSFPGLGIVPHATRRDKGRRRRWVP